MDKNKLKTKEKTSIDLRLLITPEDEIYKIFTDLKNASGIRNNSEVLRFILKQYAQIPFSELLSNIKKSLKEGKEQE